MAFFSIKCLALKWNYFFTSGVIVFVEYFNIYMKQLGFSSFHIGFTTLFGALQPLEPLFGFLGDRFRWRNLIFKVLTPVLLLITLTPLLPLVVSFPTCFVNQSETSINQGSHLSKEYLQSAVNTRHSMSFHKSTIRSFIQARNTQIPGLLRRSLLTKSSRQWRKRSGTLMYLGSALSFFSCSSNHGVFYIYRTYHHIASTFGCNNLPQRKASMVRFLLHVGAHQWQCVPLRRRSSGCSFHAQYLRRYRECLLHCICLVFNVNHVVFLRPTMVQVRVP